MAELKSNGVESFVSLVRDLYSDDGSFSTHDSSRILEKAYEVGLATPKDDCREKGPSDAWVSNYIEAVANGGGKLLDESASALKERDQSTVRNATVDVLTEKRFEPRFARAERLLSDMRARAYGPYGSARARETLYSAAAQAKFGSGLPHGPASGAGAALGAIRTIDYDRRQFEMAMTCASEKIYMSALYQEITPLTEGNVQPLFDECWQQSHPKIDLPPNLFKELWNVLFD